MPRLPCPEPVHLPRGLTKPRSGRRRGVSLLEMLVILGSVGILSLIAAARFDYTASRADSAARQVLIDLSDAHRLAVSIQSNVRVTISDRSRMLIHEDIDRNGSVGSAERVRSAPLDHAFTFSRGTAADTPSPADPTALTSLVFRRDGSANRGGTIYLSDPDDDLKCRHCRAVVVTQATGRVMLYSYATGSWQRDD